jgi:hypothetical protein
MPEIDVFIGEIGAPAPEARRELSKACNRHHRLMRGFKVGLAGAFDRVVPMTVHL